MERPFFDDERRALWFKRSLVKSFHNPAKNQQLLLTAFQEQQWQFQIDDPLPPEPGINSKTRLRDAIRCLNKWHLHRLLRFHGDGSGTAVRWETLE